MSSLRTKGKSTIVWILMGLLLLGLGGFGVTSFTGGSSEIGAVGEVQIVDLCRDAGLDDAIALFAIVLNRPRGIDHQLRLVRGQGGCNVCPVQHQWSRRGSAVKRRAKRLGLACIAPRNAQL